MRDEEISIRRFGAACVAACVAAPMPVAVIAVAGFGNPVADFLQSLLLLMLFGSPVACLHLCLLGLPTYLLLQRWWRLRWWHAAVAGFLIGAVPLSLLLGDWSGAEGTGLCGLAGGLCFWLVLHGGRRGGPPSGRSDDLDEVFA